MPFWWKWKIIIGSMQNPFSLETKGKIERIFMVRLVWCAMQCTIVMKGVHLNFNWPPHVCIPMNIITPSKPKQITLLATYSIIKPIFHQRLQNQCDEVIFRTSTNHPLTIQQEWHFLKASNDINMHTTPRLIVNCWNFIIIDNEVLGFLHNNFDQFDENLVHGFNHLITSGIKLVFVQSVPHLQKLKHVFYAFKFVKGQPSFKSKMTRKWKNLQQFLIATILQSKTNLATMFQPY